MPIIGFSLLCSCVFNGFGIERDLIPALVILEKAVDDLDYIVSYYDDEQSVSGWKSVFHNKKEYTQAFEEAKRLCKLAKDEASKLSDWEIAEKYSGLTDYDQIYERWESKRVKFIKRADKGGEAS